MATKIERSFFKAFGINPSIIKTEDCGMTQFLVPLIYPEITDRILLELICILSMDDPYIKLGLNKTRLELKDSILKMCCLRYSDELCTQVRKLFGVWNNE